MSIDAPTIVDPRSGLFTEAFLRASLPTRVATARRAMKQLGLVTMVVDAPDGGVTDTGAVGALIRDTLRDSDTGVLLDDDRFAMLLEFTPVEGCEIISHRLADRLRQRNARHAAACCGRCAGYPVHAIDADELLAGFRTWPFALPSSPKVRAPVHVAPLAD